MFEVAFHEKCPDECSETFYENKIMNYDSNGDADNSILDRGADYYGVYAYYGSMKIVIKTEEYVYGFGAAIVAVGGSMGLFLGTSCYSLCSSFIDFMQYIFLHAKSKGKVSSVS